MSKLRWIIFGAIVVLILGGLIVYSRMNSTTVDVANVDANSVIAASDQNGNIADHVYNNTQSDTVLIEYGDFQCPGCASAHPNMKQLLSEYGEKITFIYRNFPLTSIHPNARAAAAAAEAAGIQNKYWEMHDVLFENQNQWQNLNTSERTSTFKSYAESLQLDVARFEADLSSASINQKISFDQALGTKVGVDSTPAFFLNGEPLAQDAATGLLQGDLTAIKKELDESLNK